MSDIELEMLRLKHMSDVIDKVLGPLNAPKPSVSGTHEWTDLDSGARWAIDYHDITTYGDQTYWKLVGVRCLSGPDPKLLQGVLDEAAADWDYER
jgi:hypothetical protein